MASERKRTLLKMATQQTPAPKTIPVEAKKWGFDLDSKTEVQLQKTSSEPEITSVSDFTQRMGNDSSKILEVINKGYQDFAAEKLASDESIPWQLVEKDSDGKETFSPFSGSLLSGEGWKQFQGAVLNMAKLFFGYPADKPKSKSSADLEAWQNAKNSAKSQAVDMMLGNPGAIEALKKL